MRAPRAAMPLAALGRRTAAGESRSPRSSIETCRWRAGIHRPNGFDHTSKVEGPSSDDRDHSRREAMDAAWDPDPTRASSHLEPRDPSRTSSDRLSTPTGWLVAPCIFIARARRSIPRRHASIARRETRTARRAIRMIGAEERRIRRRIEIPRAERGILGREMGIARPTVPPVRQLGGAFAPSILMSRPWRSIARYVSALIVFSKQVITWKKKLSSSSSGTRGQRRAHHVRAGPRRARRRLEVLYSPGTGLRRGESSHPSRWAEGCMHAHRERPAGLNQR